ncbi:SDR family oxidoreductase [bacterium]|nr:SDR family oxidoreductase [bacterium]
MKIRGQFPRRKPVIPPESLDGRVAIVTGSSRGIGKAIAIALAKRGVRLVVAAKTEAPDPRLPGTIHDTVREIEAVGGSALAFPCDVRDEARIEALAKAALDRFGRIDILINNAGALWWKPVLETPAKRFDLVMGVNVRASFLLARACLPSMIERKWGHIVNMCPPIDLRPVPGRVAYFVSKYGMTLPSHGLAEEVKEHNIAVNALWPVTMVESQATIAYSLGGREQWRMADIVVDATLAILEKSPFLRTGKALLDEEVLREEGITDFSRYACVPGTEPKPILWEAAPDLGGKPS